MGPSTPTAQQGSSRLLSMKFMQRAAAAAESSPASSTGDERSTKRRRGNNGAAVVSSPSDFIDITAVKAAVAEKEAKRRAALEEQKRIADEHWTLPQEWLPKPVRKPGELKVEYVSRAWVDWAEPDESPEGYTGERPGRGRFMTKDYKKEKDGDDEEGEEEEEGSAEEDAEGVDGTDGPKRTKSKKKSPDGTTPVSSLARKPVKLHKLVSISGGQTTPSFGGICYNCDKPGHLARDCPKPGAHPSKRVRQQSSNPRKRESGEIS